MWQLVSAATDTHATRGGLMETAFSIGSAPRQCNEHELDSPLEEKSVDVVIWMFAEPSESKIWSWVPWNSEPRFIVLARTSSNLSVSQSLLEISAPAEESPPHYWKSWQVYTSPRIARGFQNVLRVWLYIPIMQDTGRRNPKSCKSTCTCYWTRRS
jgi:hypothetical protein